MNKRFLYLFFVIFFFSGFSGLIYESIWTHYLKLFLGHAAYAQVLVLCIFMGGMAIGSMLAANYSHKWRKLFFGYAIAEGIIGVFAILFHESFVAFLDISYKNVLQNLASPTSVHLFKWTAASLLILPQSILLGTTFPLMAAAILRTYPKHPGKNLSIIYFINSFGAATGVLVSGFYMINALGLPGTIRIAGVINIFIAITVIILSGKQEKIVEIQAISNNPSFKKIGKNKLILFLLIASFFTGMASFIYEIAWIRMLNLVLGTSTHAFELMLSAFIFGLAFGGLWIRKRIDKIQNPISYLGFIQITMGVMAMLTLLLYNNTFNFMQWVMETAPKTDTGYYYFNLASNGIAFIIMLPATFCAGMTLPLITIILLRKQGEKSIGSVYAWNTLGSIAGVIIAVHIGMPLLGLKGLIQLGAGIDLIIGIILLLAIPSLREKLKPRLIAISAGALFFLTIFFFVHPNAYNMVSGVYRAPHLLDETNSKVVFYEDGKTASISVVLDKPSGELTLKTNGKPDASIHATKKSICAPDESTMYQIALIPMALNPEAKYVANIGLGAGITTKAVLQNPKIKRVKTIEIEKQVLNAVKMLGAQVKTVFTDPRSEIVIDDAKSFLGASKQKYDIILSEPSNPWVSGVSGLYSTEFYSIVAQKLNKDGIFGQWLQLYEIDINLAVSVLKAISENFADFRVYILNVSDCLIVAKTDGELSNLDNDFISSPQISEALEYIRINNIQDVELRYLWDKKTITPFLKSFSTPANSDYHPVLDQKSVKTRFLKKYAGEMYFFTHHYHPVLFLLNKQLPSSKTTTITLDPYLDISRKANNAIALRDFFLNNNFDLHYKSLPKGLKEEISLRKDLFKEATNEKIRIETILRISMLINPYLSTKETLSIWDYFDTDEANLSSVEKACLKLSKAIMQKDAGEIINNGLYILGNRSDISVTEKEYILSAVIIGYLMQDKFDAAQKVWIMNKDNFTNRPNSNNLFNFLLAMCKY